MELAPVFLVGLKSGGGVHAHRLMGLDFLDGENQAIEVVVVQIDKPTAFLVEQFLHLCCPVVVTPSEGYSAQGPLHLLHKLTDAIINQNMSSILLTKQNILRLNIIMNQPNGMHD